MDPIKSIKKTNIKNVDTTSSGGGSEADTATLRRLVHSVMRFLEQLPGGSLAEAGLGDLRDNNLDPWEEVETRIANIGD